MPQLLLDEHQGAYGFGLETYTSQLDVELLEKMGP